MDPDSRDPPRRKRIVTDSRREQNRAAQARFRQRRKQEHLQQKLHRQNKSVSNRNLELRPYPRDETPPLSFDQPAVLMPRAPASRFPNPSNYTASPEQGPTTYISPNDVFNSSQTTASPTKDALVARRRQVAMVPADPWANAIEFIETSIFSAALQNALCLGLDPARLADCAGTYMSPFYRPDAVPRDDPAKLLELSAATLLPGLSCLAGAGADCNSSSSLSNVPANLRPTLAQLLIPHHVSFDLIPIPLLRERAIMLSVAMPHLFNVGELKLDIYMRGGLMVWKHWDDDSDGDGSGSFAKSKRSRACAPWDMKSWEAAPWFLKKWSMAVDGDGGELSRQSLSWQSLRRSQALWSELLSSEMLAGTSG